MNLPFTRTLGAGTHIIATTDSIILCDTSVGAITLVLPSISFVNDVGFKQGYSVGGLPVASLTITDNSGNAATNNITITPDTADSLSNTSPSSYVINTNSGSATFKPVANNIWNVVVSGSGGSSPIGSGVILLGGGTGSSYRCGNGNSSGGIGGTISGGCLNSASSYYTTVGGGRSNIASNNYSTVSGGYNNTSSGNASTIGGGGFNTSSGYSSTVGGGRNNTASCQYSTIGGGSTNTASNYFSTVSGGYRNIASGNKSTIGGGMCNTASGVYSAILGGVCNDSCTFDNVMIVGSCINADRVCATFVNNLSIMNIPTSSAGLPSGAVWSNSGVLTIV